MLRDYERLIHRSAWRGPYRYGPLFAIRRRFNDQPQREFDRFDWLFRAVVAVRKATLEDFLEPPAGIEPATC